MDDKGSLNRLAFSARVHCLTGCAIGEVLGLIIADALGWGNFASIPLSPSYTSTPPTAPERGSPFMPCF